MALTSERAVSALLPAPVDPAYTTARRTWRPVLWLLVVAAAYVTTMLVVVAPRVALGWDESLYASQVTPRAPAGFFSAPRARGVTYLIAPVVHFTSSPVALRTYLAVLAGVLAQRVVRAGMRAVEVPITFSERTSGASKMSRAIIVEALRRVTVWGVRARFSRNLSDGKYYADSG